MRISDWSSDVCSSDLRAARNGRDARRYRRHVARDIFGEANHPAGLDAGRGFKLVHGHYGAGAHCSNLALDEIGRASLGKECVSTCRSRWSPYHSTKKKHSKQQQPKKKLQQTTK